MNNSSKDNSGKVNFLLGFFGGMAVIAVLGFIILLIVVFNGGGAGASPTESDTQPLANQQQEEETPQYADITPISDEDYVKGSLNAPVEIIEYTDLECPFCLRHHGTVTQILNEYGDDVKYTLRHFPLSFHQNAQKAAEATECAGLQGKFFEMVEAVFEANESGSMSVDTWKKEAVNLGLNVSDFNDCLDNGEMAAEIRNDMQAGASSGVEGTPATFINGQMVSGALPYETFQSILDSLLEN